MRRSQTKTIHQGQATGPAHTAPLSHTAILPVPQQTTPPSRRRQGRHCRCMACLHPHDAPTKRRRGRPHTAATTDTPPVVQRSLPHRPTAGTAPQHPAACPPAGAPRATGGHQRRNVLACIGVVPGAAGCGTPHLPEGLRSGERRGDGAGGGGGTTHGDGGGNLRPPGDPLADATAAAPPDAGTHRHQSATGEGRRGQKKIPGVGGPKKTTPPGKETAGEK